MSKDLGNVARGHKAAINNPNVSEEAKDHSRQVLDELEQGGKVENTSTGRSSGGGNEGNVARGHKANLSNPNTSEESKQRSEQVLEDLGQ
ncbi:conidiation-specific protein 6 [Heliocybe sulcata]|uniref:Conidiation-specific protein 6 n=1 Tax=Heliocybe sulcata TaxID=5364 RepID=A0A5C3NHZ7_9AGAM|nr:conidiation-specific protein 6 [Heliocybe sulcata]